MSTLAQDLQNGGHRLVDPLQEQLQQQQQAPIVQAEVVDQDEEEEEDTKEEEMLGRLSTSMNSV